MSSVGYVRRFGFRIVKASRDRSGGPVRSGGSDDLIAGDNTWLTKKTNRTGTRRARDGQTDSTDRQMIEGRNQSKSETINDV